LEFAKVRDGFNIGFVASTNRDFTSYYSHCYKGSTKVINESIGKSIGLALEYFKTLYKIEPKNIVFYRPGVSDREM
jgi:hypothetical protein